jgi:membrane protein YdbS with pleckstrin-like domain
MRDDAQFGMSMLEHLPVVEAPDEIWASIERVLDAPIVQTAVEPVRWRAVKVAVWPRLFAGGFAVILAVISLVSWWFFGGQNRWVETNSTSRATLQIGNIGTVDVEPNTRVRVVTEKASEHRLMLAHGEIHAKITAPPRLFFVDTKSGTAVDMGCEYALRMQEDGTGQLRVSKGWVSFEWRGRESLVPAGASCKIKADSSPSVPSFDDATDGFKQALDANELSSILERARARDTLSLWHLLARVDEKDRARVYDRIAALTPLPASISRERALKLEPETLTKLKEELAWTW